MIQLLFKYPILLDVPSWISKQFESFDDLKTPRKATSNQKQNDSTNCKVEDESLIQVNDVILSISFKFECRNVHTFMSHLNIWTNDVLFFEEYTCPEVVLNCGKKLKILRHTSNPTRNMCIVQHSIWWR